MVTRNVTIVVDEETARWVRVEAARHDMSVSRFVGELLHRGMAEDQQYERAMASFLARHPRPLKEGGGYPGRAAVHAR